MLTFIQKNPVLTFILTATALTSAACDASISTAGPGPGGNGIGEVMLSVSIIPEDVQCLRVTAVGPGRTVAREFDVAGGPDFTQVMSGLPVGTVTFTGEAFAGICDKVTKSTHPTWLSDPEVVSLVVGRQSTVSLTMRHNGRAKVAVDFQPEPVCSDPGLACRIGEECCSKSCVHGLCQALPDSGASD